MIAALLCVGAYLAGSIRPGSWAARRARRRSAKSAAASAPTNVGRAMGADLAIAVLIGDASRASPRSSVGRLLLRAVRRGCGRWPAWRRIFIGTCSRSSCAGAAGKGVATSLGVALAISPVAALVRLRVYVCVY